MRPDLDDSHTIHWHGFRNAIPIFDGTPELSIAWASNRTFPYFYRAAPPRHLHVPLPLRGRRARPDGHDRHRLRAAGAGPEVRVQRRVDGVRPRVLVAPERGRRRAPTTGSSRCRSSSGPNTGRSSGSSTGARTRTRSSARRPLAAAAGAHDPDLDNQPISSLIQVRRRRPRAPAHLEPRLRAALDGAAGITMTVVGEDATPADGHGPPGPQLQDEHDLHRAGREPRRAVHRPAVRRRDGVRYLDATDRTTATSSRTATTTGSDERRTRPRARRDGHRGAGLRPSNAPPSAPGTQRPRKPMRSART